MSVWTASVKANARNNQQITEARETIIATQRHSIAYRNSTECRLPSIVHLRLELENLYTSFSITPHT